MALQVYGSPVYRYQQWYNNSGILRVGYDESHIGCFWYRYFHQTESQYILRIYQTGGTSVMFSPYLIGSTRPRMQMFVDDAVGTGVYSTDNNRDFLVPGKWFHYAWFWKGNTYPDAQSELSIYRNGTRAGAPTAYWNQGWATCTKVMFGFSGSASGPYGEIAHFKLFQVGATSTGFDPMNYIRQEIQSEAPHPKHVEDLVLYHPFCSNEDEGLLNLPYDSPRIGDKCISRTLTGSYNVGRLPMNMHNPYLRPERRAWKYQEGGGGIAENLAGDFIGQSFVSMSLSRGIETIGTVPIRTLSSFSSEIARGIVGADFFQTRAYLGIPEGKLINPDDTLVRNFASELPAKLGKLTNPDDDLIQSRVFLEARAGKGIEIDEANLIQSRTGFQVRRGIGVNATQHLRAVTELSSRRGVSLLLTTAIQSWDDYNLVVRTGGGGEPEILTGETRALLISLLGVNVARPLVQDSKLRSFTELNSKIGKNLTQQTSLSSSSSGATKVGKTIPSQTRIQGLNGIELKSGKLLNLPTRSGIISVFDLKRGISLTFQARGISDAYGNLLTPGGYQCYAIAKSLSQLGLKSSKSVTAQDIINTFNNFGIKIAKGLNVKAQLTSDGVLITVGGLGAYSVSLNDFAANFYHQDYGILVANKDFDANFICQDVGDIFVYMDTLANLEDLQGQTLPS